MGTTRDEAEHVRIPVRLGRYLATVCAPRDVATLVSSALVDVVRGDVSPRGADVVIGTAAGGHRITVDGVGWEPPADQSVVDQLIYVLLRATLDAEPENLHLHVAYVALDRRGVLIAGFPGSGKSTLAARLVEVGFDYLTDERVGVDRNLGLWPLPKPISLVPSSFGVVPHLDPARTGAGAASEQLWHVPASSIRQGSVVTTDVTPSTIVFVQFQRNAPLLLTDVHPVEAARLLLTDSPDAGRFGADGVLLAGAFCATVRAVRLVYGDGAEAVRVIRELMSGIWRHVPIGCTVLAAVAARPAAGANLKRRPEAGSVLGRADDVSGVAIGGRCLLYRRSTEQVIELDEATSSWMQLLDGRTPLREIVAEVAEANEVAVGALTPVAMQMMSELIVLGVIA